jgi:hypothetical protein
MRGKLAVIPDDLEITERFLLYAAKVYSLYGIPGPLCKRNMKIKEKTPKYSRGGWFARDLMPLRYTKLATLLWPCEAPSQRPSPGP